MLKIYNLTIIAIFLFAFTACAENPKTQDQPKDEQIKAETPVKVLERTEKQEEKPKVTFIELGSVNCVPCKMMQPVMKEIEKEYPTQVKVVFHDVWTQKGKIDGSKYKVRVIPTQVFLDSLGKEYFRHEGFFPKDELIKILKQGGVK
ncbi:MAG: thioredoxin family protein [Candidatus Delongbacteria bacterium]|nr:thioredoxin family protein [Candidatus Delongbacteria bacterium]MDD4204649.1 thioredoxin family protein [Candidatus Delongbacteria bacterium]